MKDLTSLFKQKISNCPVVLGGEIQDFTSKLTKKELSLLDSVSSQERKNEFSTGRLLLKEALKRHGYLDIFDIQREPSGAPLLPNGFLGSVSHTKSFAVSCIINSSEAKRIGIDVEPIARKVSTKIIERYLFKEELAKLPFDDENEKLIRLFSAKEALYKALNGKLNFSDIKLNYDKSGLFYNKSNDYPIYQVLEDNKYIISLSVK